MRKLLLFCFVLAAIVSFAVPAKRGVRQTITLTDGTQVSVELRGDEHAHWWQAEDGQRYVADSSGVWRAVTVEQSLAGAKRWRGAKQLVAAKRRAMAKRNEAKVSSAESKFQGKKRGLIILVSFNDKSFDTAKYGATHALYDSIANFTGYSGYGFKGCISEYFKAQSGGQFLLNFDVAGPVTLPKNYSYYGGNDKDGYDLHPDEMVREACKAVDNDVDFKQYDWDGDGVAEEVFVLYAGHGENDTKNDNLIWPHMANLSDYDDGTLTLDGVTIDTYACTSELQLDGSLAGIGTFCHEFSHCMGFPDMYDTNYGGNYGMGYWDLMCSGSYNGDTYTPAGYSGYEKMVCGWTKPVELSADTTITEIQSLADMGQTYIVYNKGNANEYYILENRQRKGFDAALPGEGMLIEHVDYNEDIWKWNVVNATPGKYYVGSDESTPYYNDHQRITVFHSGNEAADRNTAYPITGNNSLTDTSVPAAEIWNENTDGSYLMHCAITGITQHTDGTMSFSFSSINGSSVSNDSILFKETFDQCAGTGGNDGKFSGNIASSSFLPDNAGWETSNGSSNSYMYGANKCARFGKNLTGSGYVASPKFTLPGDTVTLSFRAACWDSTKEGTNLDVSVDGSNAKIIDTSTFTMKRGEWSDYTLRIVGSGACRIEFYPSKRFFLDDVVITRKHSPTTSIRKTMIDLPWNNTAIYTIDGKYVGTDLKALPHGIYIVGGKKVVK